MRNRILYLIEKYWHSWRSGTLPSTHPLSSLEWEICLQCFGDKRSWNQRTLSIILYYNEPFQHVNTVNSLLSEFHILQLPWLVIQINGNYQDINLHCILTHWILISSKYYLYYLHHDLAHKHSRFSLFYKFSANYLLHQKMHSSYTSGYKSELMLTRLCVFKIISVS